MTATVERAFKDAIRWLDEKGVDAITGDCGFMFWFQDMARLQTSKPVLLSSIVQLPAITCSLAKHKVRVAHIRNCPSSGEMTVDVCVTDTSTGTETCGSLGRLHSTPPIGMFVYLLTEPIQPDWQEICACCRFLQDVSTACAMPSAMLESALLCQPSHVAHPASDAIYPLQHNRYVDQFETPTSSRTYHSQLPLV